MSKAIEDLKKVHDDIYDEYSKLDNRILGSLKWVENSGLSLEDRKDLNKASKDIKKGLGKLRIAIDALDKAKK